MYNCNLLQSKIVVNYIIKNCCIIITIIFIFISFYQQTSINTNINININLNVNRKSNLVENFLVQLKWFIERINLEKEVKHEIELVIQMYSFMKRIFKKFNDFYSSIIQQYKDQESVDFREKQRDLLWLIYIVVKNRVIEDSSSPDAIQYQNILCGLIYSIFNAKLQQPNKLGSTDPSNHCKTDKLSRELRLPKFIRQGCGEINGHENQNQNDIEIKQFCLDYLEIQDSSYFWDIQGQVKVQLEKLCHERVLQNYPYLCENSVVYQNIQRINQYYTQLIKPNLMMDERTFLNLKQNYAPHQFTPLMMHKVVQQKQVHSLDQIGFIKNKEDIGQANFVAPNNIRKNSGSIYGGNQETPLKRAVLMYNWQFKKAQKAMDVDQKSFNSRLIDELATKSGNGQLKQSIVDLLETVLERVQQKGPRIVGQQRYLIISFFFVTLEELISNDSSQDGVCLLENEKYILSTLAICFLIHFFIKNESKINSESILEICQIEAIEFWRNLNNYNLGTNRQMPELIKSHLNETERIILYKLIWKQESVLMKVIQQNQNVQSHHQFLFQRLMYHVAIELNNLIDHLKFDIKIGEATWNIIKHIVHNKPEFLKQKHFAVIIICSLNIVSKYFEQSKGLFHISQVYQKLRNKNESEDIESKIQCGEQTRDLLYFYNKVYYEEIKYSMEKIDKSNGCLEILQKQLPNFNQIHLLDDDCVTSPLKEYKFKHKQICVNFEQSQKHREQMKKEISSGIDKNQDFYVPNCDYVDQPQKKTKTDSVRPPIMMRGKSRIFNQEPEDYDNMSAQKQKQDFESPSQHYIKKINEVQTLSSLKKKHNHMTPEFNKTEVFMTSSEKILGKFNYQQTKVYNNDDETKEDTESFNIDLFRDLTQERS